MRTVKVRILPPQPIFLPRIAAKLASARFNTDSDTVNLRRFPSTQCLFTKGKSWVAGRRSRCIVCARPINLIRYVKSRRGWSPKSQSTGEPGRLSSLFEERTPHVCKCGPQHSSGIAVAEGAREASFRSSTRCHLRAKKDCRKRCERVSEGQARTHAVHSWRIPRFLRLGLRIFSVQNSKHTPLIWRMCAVNKDRLAPRTQENYLNRLTTFLRSSGRVVLVARNEQHATIKRATAVFPKHSRPDPHRFPSRE
jgi:hypothetical protein